MYYLTGSQMFRLMKDMSDLHAGQGCGGPGGETTGGGAGTRTSPTPGGH